MPALSPLDLVKKQKHKNIISQELEKTHKNINSMLKQNFDGYVADIPAQELLSIIPNTINIDDIIDDYSTIGWYISYIKNTDMYRFSIYNYT